MILRPWLNLVCLSLVSISAHPETNLPVNGLGHLTAHIPEGWITHHQFRSSRIDLLELLPPGQDHMNWQSQLVFERTKEPLTLMPAQVLEQVDQNLKDNCYAFSRTLIFSGLENGIDSAVTLTTCTNTTTDHQGRIQLSKAIRASPDWYFIKIKMKVPAYTHAEQLQHQDLIKYWSTFLKKNTLCHAGDAISACRN